MRLSFTTMETYQQCPLKFKFREIDKIKIPQTKETFFGSLIHKVLRMLHNTNRLVPPTEEEMLQYFSQNWKPELFVDEQEKSIAFSLGVKILKNYYAKNYPGQFQIVDLEARFEAPIFDGTETHLITGIIDRIDKLEDGSFEIIDYKTTKRMPGQKIVDNNLQLVVYHLGALNRWPTVLNDGRSVKLSLYYLQHGEKLSTFRTAKQLEETKEKILLTIDKIKTDISGGKFEALPGPLCDWCSYQKYCPLFKHKFKEKTPADEEIKRLTEEYFILKEQSDKNNGRLAEIKNIIGRYYDESGVERIFSDSGYLTRSAKKTFTYDVNILKDILEPIGRWQEVLMVDAAKLKNVITSLSSSKKRLIEKAKKIEKETKSIIATKNKITRSFGLRPQK
ncbi:MAG: PD-(D/E)XK nuclease family protein [Candidatus Portnoybacteria bacterium]|nr:PD-(D/E)XK nuclease family protein [Candidatus Portnoybacteria bacterium]